MFEHPQHFYTLISLVLEEIVLIMIGAIADANEAGSRLDMLLHLNKAVYRQTELQTLKDRQDQLLLSVIPAYLADRVSKSIMATKSETVSKKSKHRKLFHDLHVQSYASVSILFADIVNFTVLAAQLSAKELVRTLNELYSKFDRDAQKLQCMRIKFLGDCYYCVSGMPVNRPNHADMCVLMGLEMIKTIKQVQLATGVDVNMRIGVHTGSVLCGVLGLLKWQFDIWSDDVTLANHMESAGKPGAVHITKTTKELLLGEYKIVEAHSKDPILIARNQPTYYILPDKTSLVERAASIYNRKIMCNADENNHSTLSRTYSRMSLKSKVSKIAEYWGAETPFANLSKISNSVEQPLINDDKTRETLYLDMNTIHSLTLIENNLAGYAFGNLLNFLKCPKPTISSSRTSYLLFPFGKKLVKNRFSDCFLLWLLAVPLSASQICLLFTYQPSSLMLYMLHIFFFMLILMIITIIDLCFASARRIFVTLSFLLTTAIVISPQLLCIFSSEGISSVSSLVWHPGCVVHLAFIFLLYRHLCIYQTILAIIDFICFIIPLCLLPTTDNAQQRSYTITVIAGSLFCELLLIFFISLSTNHERNVEGACNASFRKEEEAVETMQDINKLLIENILPSHVAAKFLNPNRPTDVT